MKDLPFWVAFNHLPGIGPVRFQKIIETFGSASDAWKASPKDLIQCLGEKIVEEILPVKSSLQPEEVFQKIVKRGIQILPISDEQYPALLRDITYPPYLLYQRGDFDFRSYKKWIALVGTRRATPYGKKAARYLARSLAEEGWVVVSGLALGIDGEAHYGALEGEGKTVAVLGTGVDIVYPGSNRGLAERILHQKGALISEFVPGFGPQKESFPVRNRLISGLSLAVVVVEAPAKSGALITVNFALEQGREVMAVPGSIFSSQSEGTHQLINQGARLVHSVADIVEELGFLSSSQSKMKSKPTLPELDPDEKELLNLLDISGCYLDELLTKTGWDSGRFYKALLSLEMKKVIQTFAGGKIGLG
ncbi:MAG: DNA-protecting protein DprA [Candidatus Atribacteria bacterium]|nr:DNA-protecting protein DprA [Candidatus Atribacteria bacterium]